MELSVLSLITVIIYSVQQSSMGGDGRVPYEVMRDGNIQTRKRVLEAIKEAVSLA